MRPGTATYSSQGRNSIPSRLGGILFLGFLLRGCSPRFGRFHLGWARWNPQAREERLGPTLARALRGFLGSLGLPNER